jgi:hypothetical protein
VEVRACANGFLQVFPQRTHYQRRRGCFPAGRTQAISAEGGVAVHRDADHVELPRLARPKGCFDPSAKWSLSSCRDASRADSDTRADYSLRHRRDGKADTTILYHLRICRRPHSSSGMTAGRRGLLGIGTAAPSAGETRPRIDGQGLKTPLRVGPARLPGPGALQGSDCAGDPAPGRRLIPRHGGPTRTTPGPMGTWVAPA